MNTPAQGLPGSTPLAQAWDLVCDFLTTGSLDPNFLDFSIQAFGNAIDPTALASIQQQWAASDFSGLPAIEILPTPSLNGARGAFSSETGKIYLSADWIATAGTSTEIASVLLEEIGHFVDSQINSTDAMGDEGAIFSNLIQGISLTSAQLQSLHQEDAIEILVNGEMITAEAAVDPLENLDLIEGQIDDLLDTIKSAISSQTLENLPLLGDLPLLDYINDFITDTLENKLLDELDDFTSAEAVQEALFDALKATDGGLGLLLDSNGDGDVTIADVELIDTADSIEYKFKLGKSFDTTLELAEELGIPGLGLKLDGGASAKLDLALDIHFGIDDSDGGASADAFFVKTNGANELQAELAVELVDGDDNPLSFTGSLGFLEVSASDNGSTFSSSFQADVTGTGDGNDRVKVSSFGTIGSATPELTANADLKLLFSTGLDLGSGIDNGILPTIEAGLNLSGLNYDSTTGITTTPGISFEDVKLDLGSFVKNFAGSILTDIKKVTEPLQPIADVLTDDLPLLGRSLIDLAELFAPSLAGTAEFLDQLDSILELVNSLPSGDEEFEISLGDFGVGGGLITQTDAPDTSIDDQVGSALGDLGEFFDTLDEEGVDPSEQNGIANDLQFPILDDPTNIIKLLLGDPSVELFTYTTPKLAFDIGPLDFPPDPGIPIFGPITLQFFVGAGASAQMVFGFDSKGLADFQAGGFTNPELIFDGFFATSPGALTPDPGDDAPNLLLYGEVGAKAGVNLGIIEIAVGGGFRLETGLSVYDPTDPLEPFKVRASDIANNSPLCLFQAEGALSAFIFAAFELDFGFFSITKRFNLLDVNLIDFETEPDCDAPLDSFFDVQNPDRSPEVQQALAEQGIIDRADTEGLNSIIVQHISGPKGDETIDLIGLDPETRRYENVKAVLLQGRDGNDFIQFIGGVQAMGDVTGGAGDDTIITGEGNDFINAGQGNDSINGGGGKNFVSYADSPNGVTVNLNAGFASNDGHGTTDTLTNIQTSKDRAIAMFFEGELRQCDRCGAGKDDLIGGNGDDVMLGGAGADLINGRDGTDTTTYLGSTVPVLVNLSNQTVLLTSPIDGLLINLSANRGYGGEAQGDRLFNLENLQGSVYGDVLVASQFGGTIDGFSGDDIILAGAGEDELNGNSGTDWLSYLMSNAGVNVSLATGGSRSGSIFSSIGLGGYAQGDQQVRFETFEGSGVFLSSFEHLEGSNFDDVLEGDSRDNILRGLAGADAIEGGDGNDTIVGGAGADTLDGDGNSATLRANTDSAFGGGDTASYKESSAGVTVSLLTGIGSGGHAEGDSLTEIENLIGSNFGDSLFGSFGDNDFNPGLSNGGVDYVNGLFGTDRLTILDYAFNDTGAPIIGGFTNTATGSGSIVRGSDTVNFDNIDRLVLTGTFQGDQVVGGQNRDVLQMGAGDDVVDGGGGNDYLDGDDGIDTLSDDLSDKTDNIVLISTSTTEENPDQSLFLTDGTLIRRFEIFKTISTGSGNDQLTQLGRVDNIFSTNAGDDIVNSGLGFDIVDGGFSGGEDGGDDLLIVDYSVEDIGTGLVMEVSSFSASNGGRVYRNIADSDDLLDEVRFDDFERFQITGTSKNDIMYGGFDEDQFIGNEGDDFVFASWGDDLVFGEEGNDQLWGGRGDDEIYGGEGDDTIIENLDINDNFTSGGDDYLDGGAGNDGIAAGEGADRLFGREGNDVLVGGLGNDQLDGGEGDDILIGIDFGSEPSPNNEQEVDFLTGGSGADQFWLGDGTYVYYNDFDSNQGSLNNEDYAYISDFNVGEGDVIQLNGTQSDYSLITGTLFGVEITSIYYAPEVIIRGVNDNAFVDGSFATIDNGDLIGIVAGTTSLNLTDSYFTYV
ncbi:MAG: calcium-binding protein [Leptolyngbyaceae cyanobacterium SL_7_1]|nr:calcium-binding protein [Leptolyngbyaceae cyanobacterium SL_7_1]